MSEASTHHKEPLERAPLAIHADAIARASQLAIADTDPHVFRIPTTHETLDSPEKTAEHIRSELFPLLEDYVLATRHTPEGTEEKVKLSEISKEPVSMQLRVAGALLPEELWEVGTIAITPENKIVGQPAWNPYDGWRQSDDKLQARVEIDGIHTGPGPDEIRLDEKWQPLDAEQQKALLAFLENFTPTPGQPVTVDQRRMLASSEPGYKKLYISPLGNTIAVKPDNYGPYHSRRYRAEAVTLSKLNGRPYRARGTYNHSAGTRITLTAQEA